MTGPLLELEFKLTILASTMAIMVDNWSGTCGAVLVGGASLS